MGAAERDFSLDPILFDYEEEAHGPCILRAVGQSQRRPGPVRALLDANVDAQRQSGFCTVEVKVPRGDLTPEQLRGLAEIMREYCGGHARTSVHQNLILRWVRDEALYDVWRALLELGLGDAGAEEITDVVSCPGTDSCKLGITSSMGLNQAITERLAGDGNRATGRPGASTSR